MSDLLGKYLGLPPINQVEDADYEDVPAKQESTKSKAMTEKLKSSVAEPMTRHDEAEADYDYARKNLYDTIEKGARALEELLDVATQSQHPRAYEVLSSTMKTLVDANKELVNLSKKKADETQEQSGSTNTVTNNNLFVGTTHDLLKVLSDMKKNG